MATNFPASLDALTNPTSSDSLSSPSHSAQHSNVNDAVEALQAKVGADSSAVTSSHDYLIADHASRITTLEGGSGGKILQVQSTVKTDSFSTAANGPVDVTGLSVSITPTDASSTILVMVTVPTTGGGGVKKIWIKRDTTDIFTTTNSNVFQWTTQSTTDPATFTMQGIDSPATTSATTYKVQIGTSGANTVRVGTDSAGRTDYMVSSITVLEVGA
jgi:hypothetical protein